jgi:hypothetical protein
MVALRCVDVEPGAALLQLLQDGMDEARARRRHGWRRAFLGGLTDWRIGGFHRFVEKKRRKLISLDLLRSTLLQSRGTLVFKAWRRSSCGPGLGRRRRRRNGG